MNQEYIIHALDLFGVAVFAVSGSLAAGQKKMDIFGVIVLGLVTALGGGTLRDLLLNTGTVFWITNPIYLWIGAISSALTFYVVRHFPIPRRALLLSDALGLAVFTLIGTQKSFAITHSATLALVMGIMTGVAGGMIRDTLSAEVPLVLRKEIYATASLFGALVYVIMNHFSLPIISTLTASVLTTLIIRLIAIRKGLSLPLFISKHDPPTAS